MEVVGSHCSHVTHVAHLLGDEAAVGKILLVGRAMRINGKRHTHLSDGELEVAPGLEPRIGIEHLDLALVAKVYLGLILHFRHQLSTDADTCRAHLETALALRSLIFIFTAQRAVHLRLHVYILSQRRPCCQQAQHKRQNLFHICCILVFTFAKLLLSYLEKVTQMLQKRDNSL